MQTLENGSLAFRQLGKEHEGLYLCEADNGVEPNLVKVVRLQVRLQAQFLDELQVLGEPAGADKKAAAPSGAPANPQPAHIQNQVSQNANSARWVRVSQNASQLRLLCQPFGEFPLTLDWLKDGQLIYTHTAGDLSLLSAPSSPAVNFNQLELAGRLHVNTRRGSGTRPAGSQVSPHWLAGHQVDSELVLTGLRRADGGLYSCAARNAFGQAERQLRLLVQEPPEAPEVVDVAHIGSRSIGLRWLAPFDGNSAIVKYLVEYRRQSDSGANQPGKCASTILIGPFVLLQTQTNANEICCFFSLSLYRHSGQLARAVTGRRQLRPVGEADDGRYEARARRPQSGAATASRLAGATHSARTRTFDALLDARGGG